MIEKIKGREYHINYLFPILKEFINSEEKKLNVKGESFSNIRETLEKLDFNNEEADNVNGWQVDYWLKFVNDNLTLQVNGSWYYGIDNIEKL